MKMDTDMMDPNPIIYYITPEMARYYLDKSRRNRPISRFVVERYKRDMANGEWVYAADPIRFSVEGFLLDGQHRLQALSELEGISLPFLIVKGLSETSQLHMDQGRKRNPGQQLALLGLTNSNAIAAATRVLIAWNDGTLFRDTHFMGLITSSHIQAWVEAHEDLVTLGNDNYYNKIRPLDAPPSVSLAMFYRCAEIDVDKTLKFFELLSTRVNLEPGNPILALDSRLRIIRKHSIRYSPRDYLALFVQAWNYWLEGRSITRFQRPVGAAWNASNFPVLQLDVLSESQVAR